MIVGMRAAVVGIAAAVVDATGSGVPLPCTVVGAPVTGDGALVVLTFEGDEGTAVVFVATDVWLLWLADGDAVEDELD
jgi:hypothetical protein